MCCEGEALSSTPFLLGWSLKIRKPAEEETGFHAKSFVVLTLFLEVHFPKEKPEVTRLTLWARFAQVQDSLTIPPGCLNAGPPP